MIFATGPYLEIFKIGDAVKCLTRIDFVDNTSHFKGEIIEVTEKNQSFFNVMHNYYEKVKIET